jgi:hypothetical protein
MRKISCSLLPERAFFLKSATLFFVCLTAVCFVSCVPRTVSTTKIKVLSLSPEDYIGSRIHLSGRLQGIGPGESYVIVEDDTGLILVGTEQLTEKIGCERGSKIELIGSLRRLKSLPHPYFSMDTLLDCSP